MLAPGKKFVGQAVRIPINFEDSSDADIDPATVQFQFKDPRGVITTYVYGTDAQLIRSDAGDYYVDVVPDRSGRWYYKWLTSGTNTTIAFGGNFVVQRDPFTDDFGDCQAYSIYGPYNF
jgi:hypothetical protein